MYGGTQGLSECGAGDGDMSHRFSRCMATHFAAFFPALSSLGGYGSVKERLYIHTIIASVMPETRSSFFWAQREQNSLVTLGFMVSNGGWDRRSSPAEAMSHALIAARIPY